MEASSIIFYILSALVLGFGIMTVTSRRFFRAAVFLLMTLLLTAGIYFLMAFNFIAIVQIMIYVGGIVVLILFSILLTQTSDNRVDTPGIGKTAAALVTAITGFVLTSWLILNEPFGNGAGVTADVGIKNIGRQLMGLNENGYVLPFELVTILLLAAMIGSIVIAFKSKEVKEGTANN